MNNEPEVAFDTTCLQNRIINCHDSIAIAVIAIKDTLRVQRESALQMLGANKTASSAEYYFLTLVCITRDRLPMFNSELPMALW